MGGAYRCMGRSAGGRRDLADKYGGWTMQRLRWAATFSEHLQHDDEVVPRLVEVAEAGHLGVAEAIVEAMCGAVGLLLRRLHAHPRAAPRPQVDLHRSDEGAGQAAAA